MSTPAQQQVNTKARVQAQAAVEGQAVQPTGRVVYRSHGRVAVIGGMEALEFAPRLQAKHHTTVVLLQGAEEPATAVIPVGGRTVNISGYLGNFTLSFGEVGKPNYETLQVDTVLDLNPTPLLQVPLPPLGYLHAASDEISLQHAQSQLDDLIGTFEKPRYFAFDAAICAHARSGQAGCTQCIDACPAEAITALAEAIEVDPYLCQGGGVCASVCPSGAIRYNYPSVADVLDHIRTVLQVYRSNQGQQPAIAFVAEGDVNKITVLPDNVIPVVVEEVASIGMDIWLTTLAYGANRVVLINGGDITSRVLAAVQTQLVSAAEILVGLGYPATAVQLVTVDALAKLNQPVMPPLPPASYAGFNEKRRVMFMAIDHLFARSPAPHDILPLSAGAPFGTINVDTQTCTLCLSCTSVCPTHAVFAGNEAPQLLFNESQCVQCGICASACPEHSITLLPRLLANPEQRQHPVMLHHETPLGCIRCGKPFATQAVVNAMQARLGSHWMFQSERAKQRLQMCDDCRVADIVQDPEAMQQSFMAQRRH